eukprot:3543324-Amphidinium_carterae.1
MSDEPKAYAFSHLVQFLHQHTAIVEQPSLNMSPLKSFRYCCERSGGKRKPFYKRDCVVPLPLIVLSQGAQQIGDCDKSDRVKLGVHCPWRSHPLVFEPDTLWVKGTQGLHQQRRPPQMLDKA